MTLIKADRIEVMARKRYNNLQASIAEFVTSDMDCVQVTYEPGEYKSTAVCYNVLRNAVRRSKVKIRVAIRHDKIYMIKCND